MRDFTTHTYKELLLALQQAGFNFYSFEDYCSGKASGKFVILRHDVDLRAGHSLRTAIIESDLNIRASYYFRVVPQSNQPRKILAIASLGHEIGYHYEDLSICNGNIGQAIAHFEKQLAHFRQFYPVKTVCMHGSPTSKYDNRALWKKYNYRDFGIIGEPYFDVNFEDVFYLTDTGRCWDGEKFSVRDKVQSSYTRSYHSSFEIIADVNNLPDKIMITTHPQRWTNNYGEWIAEYILQNMKNVVKRLIVSGK
jgi:hypothetical protein